MGRAREDFERYAEAAGLEPPPRGKLAEYAADVLAQVPRLLAGSSDADEERHHALREMENVANGLLAWIEDTTTHHAPASRAARGTPGPAAAPTPAQRASTRTAAVRDRYRRRRMQ